MKNKKWKQFEKLTEQCYMNMIGADKDGICWEKAFELLMEIVREERQKEPNWCQGVYMLDENTDYQYDISEWLEDCLDEIDMREEYEVLLGMCDTLLSLFAWPDYTGSDLKFRKSSVLEALGRNNEAVSFYVINIRLGRLQIIFFIQKFNCSVIVSFCFGIISSRISIISCCMCIKIRIFWIVINQCFKYIPCQINIIFIPQLCNDRSKILLYYS